MVRSLFVALVVVLALCGLAVAYSARTQLSLESRQFMGRLASDKEAVHSIGDALFKYLRVSDDEFGDKPNDGDNVSVFMEARVVPGAPFLPRSTAPLRFNVDDVIPPVAKMLKALRRGDRVHVWVPVEAYYPDGFGPAKPDGVLQFELELYRINSKKGEKPDFALPPFKLELSQQKSDDTEQRDMVKEEM